MNLSNTQLFRGLEEAEITSLLGCLNATTRSFQKGEVILSEGNITENIGILLSGLAVISCNDIWGNTSILGHVAPGSVFAEVYACIPGEPMLVTVSAAEDTSILFMNVGRVLATCTNACPFHTRLVRNLLTVCAHRNLHYNISKCIGPHHIIFLPAVLQGCRCLPVTAFQISQIMKHIAESCLKQPVS